MPCNSDYKNNPQAFEEINTRKGGLKKEKINVERSTNSSHQNRWDSPIRTLSMGRFCLFLFKQNLLAFQKEVLYNSTCR